MLCRLSYESLTKKSQPRNIHRVQKGSSGPARCDRRVGHAPLTGSLLHRTIWRQKNLHGFTYEFISFEINYWYDSPCSVFGLIGPETLSPGIQQMILDIYWEHQGGNSQPTPPLRALIWGDGRKLVGLALFSPGVKSTGCNSMLPHVVCSMQFVIVANEGLT